VKLHCPALEKKLRKRVKAEVRRSQELRREARGARVWRKEYSINLVFRVCISLFVGFMAGLAGAKTQHPATALAVITVWSFFLVFIAAQRLLTTLYAASDLPALSLLPVENATIFRWQFQKFARGSVFSLLDLLCAFTAVASWLQFPPIKWLALLPIVALAWLTLLALAMLSAVYLPSFPYHIVSLLGFLVALVILFARDYVGAAALALLDRAAPHLNVVLPTGWPVSLFQVLLPQPAWLLLTLLLPTAAVIVTVRHSMARLRSNYGFHEVVMAEAPDMIPEDSSDAALAGTAPSEQPSRVGVTAIEDMIRSRQFMAAPQWQGRGWIERLLWRWITPREKSLAEFAFPDGFIITRGWKRIGKTFVVTTVATIVIGYFFPAAAGLVLALGLFICGCQVLARVLDNGRAFRPIPCSGVNIPMYAAYPIGYGELSRLLWKYTTAQALPLLAFMVTAAVVTAYVLKAPLSVGAIFGGKLAVLLLGARPFALALAFSATTNDTARIRLRVFALIALIVGGGLLFLGLAAGTLFWPGALAWISCLAAVLQAYICFRIYGWFYNRNNFDLMNSPKR
jgi:hypothetical protein